MKNFKEHEKTPFAFVVKVQVAKRWVEDEVYYVWSSVHNVVLLRKREIP